VTGRSGGSPRRALAVVAGHALVFQTITFLLRPTASYRALELDVPTALFGVLGASFALVPLLVAIPAGDLADRFGEARLVVAGSLLVSGAIALFVFTADSFATLLLAVVVLGTGHLLCMVGQQALVAGLAPSGKLDSAYGFYTFAGSIGQAAGPGLLALFGAGAALPRTDDAFRAAALLAVGMLVLALCCRSSPRRPAVPDADAPDRRVLSLLRIPGMVRGLMVSSAVIVAMDITLVYLPALGAEKGWTVGTVGALLAARSVATMASRLATGALTRRLGRRRLLAITIGVSACATATVPLPVPLWLVAVAVVVMGFGLGVCMPATLAWLAEIGPAGLQGRIVALRLVGNRLGQVVIPSSIGLVAAGLGAAGVLWLTAVLLAGAAATSRSVPMDQAVP
jgi:MFS family permease